MSLCRPRRLLTVAAVLAGLAWALVTTPGWAVLPDEMMADPALEARARDISKELRCLVCQNQSIDDSNAGLARDLRLLVRERLQAGDSDDAVVAYLTARYGDFVRLRPPFQPNTWLLWLAPPLVLVAGATGIAWRLRRRRGAEAPTPLTADERERLRKVLDDGAA
jgi:cytochrome c-type biogenesis protein CcmH